MWSSKWKGKPNVQYLSRFDTVQAFWKNFKDHSPTSIPDKSYLHVFKEGIAPLWEDPQNVNGGHFKLTTNTAESSLRMWQTIVLNLIGGLFPMENCVNGASIVVHGVGNNLIKVWLSSADKDTVARTKSFLVDILDPQDYVNDKVTFVPHKLVLPSNNTRNSAGSSNVTPSASSPVHVVLPTTDLDLASTVAMALSKKGQKRRKSTESSNSASSNSIQSDNQQASFRIAVTLMKSPVCCGPEQVRFAHDPYSMGGGCTYNFSTMLTFFGPVSSCLFFVCFPTDTQRVAHYRGLRCSSTGVGIWCDCLLQHLNYPQP
eukprot:EG_transcript_14547